MKSDKIREVQSHTSGENQRLEFATLPSRLEWSWRNDFTSCPSKRVNNVSIFMYVLSIPLRKVRRLGGGAIDDGPDLWGDWNAARTGRCLVLIYKLRKRPRGKRKIPTKARGYYFAITSMVASSIVAIAIALSAFVKIGLSFDLLTLALWCYIVARLRPGLKLLKGRKLPGSALPPSQLERLFLEILLLPAWPFLTREVVLTSYYRMSSS